MPSVLDVLLLWQVEQTLKNESIEKYSIDLPLVVIALRIGSTDFKLAFNGALIPTVTLVIVVPFIGSQERFSALVLKVEPHRGLEGGRSLVIRTTQNPVVG
jgi:hypothetical protein